MNIFEQRRSIRKYKTDFKISDYEFNEILRLSFKSPSSMNLQPTKVIVIKDEVEKNMLNDTLYGNHLQLRTSSHLIIVLTDLAKFSNAKDTFTKANKAGLMPDLVLEKQINNALNVKTYLSDSDIRLDNYLDSGLFSMQFMLVAKYFGYDTCPIGGFNKEKVKEVFKLPSNLEPVLIISIGKADELGHDSHRLELADLVFKIK